MRHYSPRTEEAYVAWTRRFVRFHGMRHPRTLGPADVSAFLSDLATGAKVSASTQNRHRRRHHVHESVVQKAVALAAHATRIGKRVTCHTFRHSFATHLLESGYDIRTIQG